MYLHAYIHEYCGIQIHVVCFIYVHVYNICTYVYIIYICMYVHMYVPHHCMHDGGYEHPGFRVSSFALPCLVNPGGACAVRVTVLGLCVSNLPSQAITHPTRDTK